MDLSDPDRSSRRPQGPGARFARWKNPDQLTTTQALRLERIRLLNEPLYTAYLLRESLRLALHENPDAAERQLDQWLADARSATSPAPFHAAAATIERYRERILAALRHRLTNARIEAINTTLRLLVRRAWHLRGTEPLRRRVLEARAPLASRRQQPARHDLRSPRPVGSPTRRCSLTRPTQPARFAPSSSDRQRRARPFRSNPPRATLAEGSRYPVIASSARLA